MDKQFLKKVLLWGSGLWLFGYLLGIILFPVVPTNFIGWVIMPLGVAITIYVLLRKLPQYTQHEYIFIGVYWTSIAIAADYIFLVLLFKPTDGYYKLDVYVYYLCTFFLPPLIGYLRNNH